MADAVRMLFVDDEEGIRLTMPPVLAKYGFEVTAVGSVGNALVAMDCGRYDVLLTDLNVEKPGDGLSVIAAMKVRQPKCTNLILTAFPDFETAQQAIRFNVADYFVKPVDVEALLNALSHNQIKHQVVENTSKLRADLNQTFVETLLADLDLALTFAQIAATSEDANTRNRNRANARSAFLAIRDDLLPRCSVDESQQLKISGKVRELRSRLEKLGEKVS